MRGKQHDVGMSVRNCLRGGDCSMRDFIKIGFKNRKVFLFCQRPLLRFGPVIFYFLFLSLVSR